MADTPAGEAANAKLEDGASLFGAGQRIESLYTEPDEGDDNDTSRETPRNQKPRRKPDADEIDSPDDEEIDDDETVDDEEDSEVEDDDTSEDGDDDEDLDESDEDDEDEDEDRPKGKTRKLTIKDEDGKDVVVEVDDKELETGYMLRKDYTRKTMAHAAAVKKFATEELEPVRAERQQYAANLAKLEQLVVDSTGGTEDEPNWEDLRSKLDPEEFTAVFAQYQANKQRLTKIRAERERVAGLQRKDAEAQFAEHIRAEGDKLLEALPAWRKPEVAAREQAKLIQYAKNAYGFGDSDLSAVTDHRILLILNKAMKLDAMADKREKIKAKVKKATAEGVRPGSRREEADSKKGRSSKARKRARDTGRTEDAAAAIFDILPD